MRISDWSSDVCSSDLRTELPKAEFDPVFGLQKYNPLAAWTQDDVWAAIKQFDIPYNPLHDQGYPSIGCEPCTRAVRAGEDERAGRWWWEQKLAKECGLHAGNLKDCRSEEHTSELQSL